MIVRLPLESSTSTILLFLHYRSIHYLLSQFDHPLVSLIHKTKQCYLNSTFQHLYYNFLFGELVFKINCYTILNGLKTGSQHFVHNFQTIMIFRELQKHFGEIYLDGGKNISTDMFFIVANITTNFQMDGSESEEVLYTMLSE